jgi:hypothetical protein
MNTEAIRAAYQRFPHHTLDLAHTLDEQRATDAAEAFRRAVQLGVLMSLGFSALGAVAGEHQLGGLLFTARILPLRNGTRRDRPARMGVMISHTPADEIDIHVLEYARGTDHTRLNGIYIDQLNRALLALDYDGTTPLNPRYWP